MAIAKKPRSYTEQEVRSQFIEHIRDLIEYWSIQPGSVREALSGIAHSILVALDGNAVALPAFRVIPYPHSSDRAFQESRGENWVPDDCDIAGHLHEELYRGWQRLAQ